MFILRSLENSAYCIANRALPYRGM